ncbi:hypothetical protein DAVIS_05243 [Mycobacterium marinum]|uniref:Uncharacterized protein n=1 Tax=Mycobacterium marinum TaxID=1781 RepID=A0A3E2MN91_MYCMR|nr:hypothetical protein DAVIS_05243 [Mycobacterium marinum]GJO58002.1 hypothetical protein NJB1604_51490 [Mycobacterium marinum]
MAGQRSTCAAGATGSAGIPPAAVAAVAEQLGVAAAAAVACAVRPAANSETGNTIEYGIASCPADANNWMTAGWVGGDRDEF